MKVEFESDFQKKILYVSFLEPTLLKDTQAIEAWKKQWMEALKAWHSPYKALIDFSKVNIEASSEDFQRKWKSFFDFLSRFFLRKAVIWGFKGSFDLSPFESVSSEEEAFKLIGIRERKRAPSDDFRSQIHIDNHFEQQNVEISFLAPVVLNKEKLAVLRSKMTNNLMLWHSEWFLLVDCSNLEMPPEIFKDFEKMIVFLKSFFLKELVGYSPASKEAKYPFPVYRSRHRAASQVKGSGNTSGRDAHCKRSG